MEGEKLDLYMGERKMEKRATCRHGGVTELAGGMGPWPRRGPAT